MVNKLHRMLIYPVAFRVLLSQQVHADIPLPEGLMPPVDETDDLREELEAQNKGPDKWVELGLHTVH